MFVFNSLSFGGDMLLLFGERVSFPEFIEFYFLFYRTKAVKESEMFEADS